MKYLVTVSDDFGFSEGVNNACIDAYQNGFLKEISLMIDYPGTEHAVQIIKEKKILNVGIHLTLGNLNETGKYLRTNDYKEMLVSKNNTRLIERVVEEFEKFEKLTGRKPSHINSHQGVLEYTGLIDVVGTYARNNNLHVRKASGILDIINDLDEIDNAYKSYGAKLVDETFAHINDTYEEAKKGFLKDLDFIRDGEVAEFVLHVGKVDSTLEKYSSLLKERERDYKVMMDKEFEQNILEKGFQIVSFRELSKLKK